MEDLKSLLGETALFMGLTSGQIEKVLGISRRVTFRENDIIMEEGQIGDAMYVLLEGSVEVIKRLTMKSVEEDDSDEKNKVLTNLSAEQHSVFGEIALLEESRRTATVRAMADCVLCEIRKNDFLKLAESDYELGYRVLLNLSRIVSSRLRKVDEDTVKLTTVLSLVLKED